MPRPLKHTIDYFPHFVNSGKTMMILQNEFGNDGYAFWFKLLSLLCKTDGQVYDYNNPASWRLLLAETHVNEDIANRILQLLSEIDAIDSELYQSKTIWVQHLVDNLTDVYTRRRNGFTPTRPVIANIKAINVNNSTQTRPDHTKPNHTKQKETLSLPSFVDKELWTDFLEMRKQIRKPATAKAQELLVKDLEKLRAAGNDPNEVIRQSIKNSYQGLFPLKGDRNGAYKGNPRGTKLPTKYTEPPYDPELAAFAETARRERENSKES